MVLHSHRQYYNREYETRPPSPIRRHSPQPSRSRRPSPPKSPTFYRKDYSRSQHHVNDSTNQQQQQQQQQQQHEQEQEQDQHNCSIHATRSYDNVLQIQSSNDINENNIHAHANKAMSDACYSHGRSRNINCTNNGVGGSPNSVIGLNVKDLASRYGSTNVTAQRRSRSQSQSRNRDYSSSAAGLKNNSIRSSSLHKITAQYSPNRRFIGSRNNNENDKGMEAGNREDNNPCENDRDDDKNKNISSDNNQATNRSDQHSHRRRVTGEGVQQYSYQQHCQDKVFKRSIGSNSSSRTENSPNRCVQYGQWSLSIGNGNYNNNNNYRNDHLRPKKIVESPNNDSKDNFANDNSCNSGNNEESSSDPSTATSSINSRRGIQNLASRHRSRSRSQSTRNSNIPNDNINSKCIYGQKINRHASSKYSIITNGNKDDLVERNGKEQGLGVNTTVGVRKFGNGQHLRGTSAAALEASITSKEEVSTVVEQNNVQDDDHPNDKNSNNNDNHINVQEHHRNVSKATTATTDNNNVLEKAHFWRRQLSNQRSRSNTVPSSNRKISTPAIIHKSGVPAVEPLDQSKQHQEGQLQSSKDNCSKNQNQNQNGMKKEHLPKSSTKPTPSAKEKLHEEKRRNDHAKLHVATNAASNILFTRHLQYMQQKSRAQREDITLMQTRAKGCDEARAPQQSMSEKISENEKNVINSKKDISEAVNDIPFPQSKSKISYRGDSIQSQADSRGNHENSKKLKGQHDELKQGLSKSQGNHNFGFTEPKQTFTKAKPPYRHDARGESKSEKIARTLTEDEQKFVQTKAQFNHRHAEIITSTNKVPQKGKELYHRTSINRPQETIQSVKQLTRNDRASPVKLIFQPSTETTNAHRHTITSPKTNRPNMTPEHSTPRGKMNEERQNHQHGEVTQADVDRENQKIERSKLKEPKHSPGRSMRNQESQERPRSRHRQDMMKSLQSMRNNTKALNDIIETHTATPPRLTIDNYIGGQSKSPMSVSPSRKSLHERIRKFNTGGDAPLPPQYQITEKTQYRELHAEVQESDSKIKKEMTLSREEQGSVKEGGNIQRELSISESHEAFESIKSDSQQEFGENSTIADHSLSLSVSEAKKRLWDTNERLQTCQRAQKGTSDNSADRTIESSDGETTMFKSKFVRAAEASQSIHKTNSSESQSSHQYSRQSFGRSANSPQDAERIRKPVYAEKQQNLKEEKILIQDQSKPSNPQSGSNIEKHLDTRQQVKQTIQSKSRIDEKPSPLNHRELTSKNRANDHKKRFKNNQTTLNRARTMNNNSVAKLVAKLTSVKRDDPSAALKMIDSILKSESRELGMIEEDEQASQQEQGQGLKSFQNTLQDLKSNDYTSKYHQEEAMSEKDDSDSCYSDSDESTVSAITDPTYQSGFGDTSSIISYSTISRNGKKRQFNYHVPRDGGPSPLHHPYLSSRASRHRKSSVHSSTRISQGVSQERKDLNISLESDGHNTSATMASPPTVRRLQNDSNSKAPSPNSPSKQIRGGTSTENRGLLKTIKTWDENSDESINASITDEFSKKQPSSPTCSERIKRMSANEETLSPADRIKRLAQTVDKKGEDVVRDPHIKRFMYPQIPNKSNSGEEAPQEDTTFPNEQQKNCSYGNYEEQEKSPRETGLPEGIASAFDDVNVSFGSQNIFSSKAKGKLSFLSPLAKKVEKIYNNYDS